MAPTVLAWMLLAVSAPVAALWAVINFHPALRSNLRFRINPRTPDPRPHDQGEPGGSSAPTEAVTPATFGRYDALGRPRLADTDRARRLGLHSPLDGRPDEDWPAVCIIVPGRNEEQWIPHSLPRLIEQDYPRGRFAVIFVDDDSEDATPRIAAELTERFGGDRSPRARFHVLRNDQPPPAGWVGKCWAMQQGWRHAQSLEVSRGERFDFICFTDADVLWAPGCLRAAVREAAVDRREERLGERAGLVSLIADLRFSPGVAGVVQAITQVQMVMALGILYPLEKAMDPAVPWTLAGGPFILADRQAYAAIGGHEAVRDRIVDDIELGIALKKPAEQGGGGVRVRLFYAPEMLATQMYNDWSDMWEGFTKNSYAALHYNPWELLAAGLATLLTNVLVPIYPLLAASLAVLTAQIPGPDGLQRPWMQTSWPAFLALGLSLVALGFNLRANAYAVRAFRLPIAYATLGSLGAALFLSMVVGSAWRYHFGGGNVWKGRAYGRHGRLDVDSEAQARGGRS